MKKRTVSVQDCRDAEWHFDHPNVAKMGLTAAPSEIVIQASIVKGLPLIIPCMVAAVPNGTFTPSYAARARAKKEGVATGYPDLIIDGIGPNRGLSCRAEIKSGASITPEQFDMLTLLHDEGHLCGVFRSLETLVGFLVQSGWKARGPCHG